jgi:hypothetical protein
MGGYSVRYNSPGFISSFSCRQLLAAAVLLLSVCWLVPPMLLGQEPTPAPTPTEERTSSEERSVDPFAELPGYEGECPPPSTQEKIMIGVGALALAVICFFLLVRLTERRYIQRDKSATLGRHLGFSLTLVLSALGLLALVYLIAGCLHPEFWLWFGFCGAVWLIHGIYTLIVVRGD